MRSLIIILFLSIITGGVSFSQTEDGLAVNTKKKGAFNEPIEVSKEDIVDEIPYYYRHHKKLPAFFTGYVIELTTSDLPLRRDYVLFERFGNVLVDQMEEGGFSYLIQGFRNEKAAQSFLDNIVIHNAPEAKIYYYNKGERK